MWIPKSLTFSPLIIVIFATLIPTGVFELVINEAPETYLLKLSHIKTLVHDVMNLLY